MPITPNSINYLVAVPLIVMSYHVYGFFATEPWIIRVALAVSFDILVVVCFYLLKDEHIKSRKSPRQMTYAALGVLIGFQLYVNVWAYADLAWYRALVSGAIFPLTVGMISYIAMRREERQEEMRQRRTQQRQQQVTSSAPKPELPKNGKSDSGRTSKDWKDQLVKKGDVKQVWAQKRDAEQVRQHFSGCRNMKSVKRWITKLDEGGTL